MKISVLCALTLLACISVNQAAVRVVDWPPKTGGRTAQDNVPVRVVKWPSKSNERGSKSSKVLSDPLKWMSDDSKRFFQNTDGLNWVEIQEGKEPNVFTEVWRKGSDDSLVVLLKRSDNLYVKLSEGMAWWSWNMGFPENNKIGEGSWKKVDSTRDAVENGEDEDCDDDQAVRSPYKIINREEPVDEDCDDDQAVRSPYKIINREEPVDEDCDDDQAVRGPYKPINRGDDDKAVRSPYKIINREEPVDEDCDDDQAVRSPYKIINREEQVDEDCDEDDVDTNKEKFGPYVIPGRKSADSKTRESKSSSKQIMNPQKLGSKDCRPSEDAKKNFLKFVLERDSKRVYRRTLKADNVCATTCNEQKLMWTGSWGAVEPKDVTVCECRDPRVSSRVSNFDRHSKEVNPSECEAVFCESVVDLHNKMRVKHQVDALKVDASLSTAASIYAKKLVSIGELRHSNLSDVGENLAYRMQTPPHRLTYKYCKKLGDQITRMWYDEVEQYDFASGQAKTSNADVSHFTQLVWAGSNQVGCGLAIDSTDTRQKFFGVVRYSPPGNVDGQYVDNVKPASRLMSAVNWP